MTNTPLGSRLEQVRALDTRITSILSRWLAWSGVCVCLIVAANVAADYDRMRLPGASVELFWSCVAIAAFGAVMFVPAVFKRLNALFRTASFVLLLALFIMANVETQSAYEAYLHSPAGKKAEADAYAAATREEDANRAARMKWLASPEYAAQQAAEAAKNSEQFDKDLAACFSTFGDGIPKLTSQVKESLENPAAFEYINTEKIGDITSLYNVEIKFRAQNGFGAIRTASARAKINPADCSVTEIDKITD